MKKTSLLLICAIIVSAVVAQRSMPYLSSDRFFNEGKAMFNDRNYAGCIHKITEYKRQDLSLPAVAEADFLLASCVYHQGRKDAVKILREYLDTYPESPHGNEIAFMLASVYFAEENYAMARYWFKTCNIDYLSQEQQDDYAYRTALLYLDDNDYKEALRLFSLLNQSCEKYRSAANYYLAYLAYKQQDYDTAQERFANLKSHPDYKTDAQYYITQIAFAQKQYAQVIQDGAVLLKNNTQNTAFRSETERIVGISYYQQNNYSKSIEYLKPLTDRHDAVLSGKDYFVLGSSYYQLQQYLKAIEYLNRSNPQNDLLGQNVYLLLGQSYLQTGDKNQALRAFESASRINSDSSAQETALYNYAMLLYQNEVSGFGEAVTVLEQFVNTYPKSVYADKVNNALVNVYLTTKSYDTALNSIAKIKQPGPKILEAKQKILYHLATIELTNNRYEKAIDYFTKAITVGDYAITEKQESIYWRGESYYRQEKFQQAATDFQDFLNSNPKNTKLQALSYYDLAYCAFKQAQFTQAKTHFQNYIQKEKSDTKKRADAYARLGDCYFNQRQFKEAEISYNQSYTLLPETGDYVLFQKAYVLGLQKDYKAKMTEMERLLSNFPNSLYFPNALYEKGRAAVLLNQTETAITTYQQLMNKYPNTQQARSAGLQIGLLYYNLNQIEKALAAYKKIIALYPGSEEAKESLQDLKSIYVETGNVNAYADYVKTLDGMVKLEVSEQDSLTYLSAERLFQKGQTVPAQKAFENYLKQYPKGAYAVSAQHYLANIYYEQKNVSAAQQAYSQVLSAGDTQFSEEAIGRTAEIQYSSGDYKAAMESYNRLKNVATSKGNREVGLLGVLRSASKLGEQYAIVSAANELLKDKSLKSEIANEALYSRAKAYNELGEKAKAKADWESLAADTRTAYGAEAKYLLAQAVFDAKANQEAKNIIQDYMKQGTPHQYWLAKSVILLADIFISEKNPQQARQWLESLKSNYKEKNDDISRLIELRMEKLK